MINTKKLEVERLQQLNEKLNSRLAESTAALSAAKDELETFNSLVSHELRAPLRHMDGFARLVLDRASDMDEKTKDYLSKIVAASEKMAKQIDGLSTLSRLSRAEFSSRSVDLMALVAGVRQECSAAAVGRDVEWQIDELPCVEGDACLLRQAFMNLISNAFKFTRNCTHAVIEVRVQSRENGEVEICIRDNGVGFEMRFAGKLYGVFQRLHHEREFEGLGIGLTVVRKIIERHGGKTWAIGELGKGATFYLRLKRAGQAAVNCARVAA